MEVNPPSDCRHTKLVELFGIPGAGKSTLTDRLDLPSQAITRDDLAKARRELGTLELTALLARILADWRWLAALIALAIKTPIWRLESLNRLVRVAAMKPWLASQRGLVVLDQGPLQGLWSIFFTEGVSRPPAQALSRVLELLYSDIEIALVEIAIDPELAAQRVTARDGGNSRLDDLPPGAIRSKLHEVGDLPAELLGAARRANLNVKSLSGEKDIATLVAQVQQLVDGSGEQPSVAAG